MNPFLRSALYQSAVCMAVYIAASGVLIFTNKSVHPWEQAIVWPGFWLIWVFAYWPIALAAPVAIWKIRPTLKTSGLIHGAYIALALIAMQVSIFIGSPWPSIIIKLGGLSVLFFFITAMQSPGVNTKS